MQERRRFPRLKYPCKLMVNTPQEEIFSIHTENISSGGLRVILQKKLDINSPLGVELAIGSKKIMCKGRVSWVLEINSLGEDRPNLFDTGVEFTQIEPEDRKFLADLIEEAFKRA